MPGPGPHLMYAMSSGVALTALSNGRFGPHHTLTYTLNAFFGPDIGSFSEWLGSTIGFGFGSGLADAIHHPFYYVLILGIPLCFFYSWLSSFLLRRSLLHSLSGVALTKRQCLLLISAGSLSHFFLDHLFEENGHSSMYTWILSTGWWKTRAPINPDAVVVVSLLCTCLLGGFIYINRVKSSNTIKQQSNQSVKLILVLASLYCLWCVSQIYWVNPRRPAVGEEADLGVFVFLATYLFLPHYLCILSMHPRDLEAEVKSSNTIKQQSNQSVKLILVLASLYCLWYVRQIYWLNPRRPALGEEADLGVFVFLAAYLFLPHYLCILSTHPRDLEAEQIPL